MTPAIAHVPPSCTKSGPPESPWQTELAVAVDVVWIVRDVTTVMVADPARSVAAVPWPASLPQPLMIAVSAVRASRLRSSGFGVRPMSAGISTTPTSNCDGDDSRHDGCAANELASCCGPVPRNTCTDAAGDWRQCAAVRIARGAITVPLHAPDGTPFTSFMLSSTTAELSVEQSTPLTIAVDAEIDCAMAPHALVGGSVGGAGAGVDGAPPPPPPHAAASRHRSATALLLLISRIRRM